MSVQQFGYERRERRDQPAERGEHLVERGVGARLARLIPIMVLAVLGCPAWSPKAGAAAADVPVRQVVQERLDGARRAGDLIAVERTGDLLGQPVEPQQDPTVERRPPGERRDRPARAWA